MKQTVNTNKFNTTVKTIANQLRYFFHELAVLLSFDNNLNENTKDKMATTMKEKEDREKSPKGGTIKKKLIQEKT